MTDVETTRTGADEPMPTAGAAIAEEAEHEHPRYMLVWLWLFILTVLEVGVAFLTALPKGLIVAMLLIMALWKAALVAMFYMHLKFEPKRLRWIAASPILPAVLMVVIILMEYV